MVVLPATLTLGSHRDMVETMVDELELLKSPLLFFHAPEQGFSQRMLKRRLLQLYPFITRT